MNVVLTSSGNAHLIEREGPQGFLTNAFDGLLFGAGNDEPALSDVLESISDPLGFVLRVEDGYPKLDDTDGRNAGRGPQVWTWKFVREAEVPFVASNVALVNRTGGVLVPGSDVGVSAKQTIDQPRDERLIVWVNASLVAEPSIYTAYETALQNRVQRHVGFAANVRALSAAPDGSVVDHRTVRVRSAPGQYVWTAADVMGIDGQALGITQVSSFALLLERHVASSDQWESVRREQGIDCAKSVLGAYSFGDRRWQEDGGYNVAHIWNPPRGTEEGTYRLTYKMRLCDGDVRLWRTIVEVRE